MSDRLFRELLGVAESSSRRQIRKAFHEQARRNHPDFYPEERKADQEMKMIALNEAYRCLMEETVECGQDTAPVPGTEAGGKAVGSHGEPAYAYYKQGFIHYSRALHGIQALFDALRQGDTKFKPREATDYPRSPWSRDASLKLRRIERFSDRYRRIIGNLQSQG